MIKAVNYDASRHTLLVRLQGSRVPAAATVTIHTITAAPTDAASLAAPNTIRPVARSLPWSPRSGHRPRAPLGGSRGDHGAVRRSGRRGLACRGQVNPRSRAAAATGRRPRRRRSRSAPVPPAGSLVRRRIVAISEGGQSADILAGASRALSCGQDPPHRNRAADDPGIFSRIRRELQAERQAAGHPHRDRDCRRAQRGPRCIHARVARVRQSRRRRACSAWVPESPAWSCRTPPSWLVLRQSSVAHRRRPTR